MSISIVTVTYNSSSHIKKYFESILKQNYPLNKVNIVIVDNNSPDKNLLKPIIDKYKTRLTIKTIYRTRNYGFADSCNLGARYSSHNILFLNPDTQLRNTSLSILESHFVKSSANIIGGKTINPKNNTLHRTAFNKVTISIMLYEFCNIGKIFNISSNFYIDQKNQKIDANVGGVGGGYMLIDKSSFKALNGFDTNFFMYLEDVDICMRARKMNMKIIYCPHSIINHIGGASSSNKNRISHSAWYKSREYYADKNYAFPITQILTLIYKLERIILTMREKLIR